MHLNACVLNLYKWSNFGPAPGVSAAQHDQQASVALTDAPFALRNVTFGSARKSTMSSTRYADVEDRYSVYVTGTDYTSTRLALQTLIGMLTQATQEAVRARYISLTAEIETRFGTRYNAPYYVNQDSIEVSDIYEPLQGACVEVSVDFTCTRIGGLWLAPTIPPPPPATISITPTDTHAEILWPFLSQPNQTITRFVPAVGTPTGFVGPNAPQHNDYVYAPYLLQMTVRQPANAALTTLPLLLVANETVQVATTLCSNTTGSSSNWAATPVAGASCLFRNGAAPNTPSTSPDIALSASTLAGVPVQLFLKVVCNGNAPQPGDPEPWGQFLFRIVPGITTPPAIGATERSTINSYVENYSTPWIAYTPQGTSLGLGATFSPMDLVSMGTYIVPPREITTALGGEYNDKFAANMQVRIQVITSGKSIILFHSIIAVPIVEGATNIMYVPRQQTPLTSYNSIRVEHRHYASAASGFPLYTRNAPVAYMQLPAPGNATPNLWQRAHIQYFGNADMTLQGTLPALFATGVRDFLPSWEPDTNIQMYAMGRRTFTVAL